MRHGRGPLRRQARGEFAARDHVRALLAVAPLIDELENRSLLANLSVVSLTFTDFFTNAAVANPVAGQVVKVTGRLSGTGFNTGVDVFVRRTTPGGDVNVGIATDSAWFAGTTVNVDLKRYVIPPGASTITFKIDPDSALGETNETDNTITINLNTGTVPASGLTVPSQHSLPGANYGIYLSFTGNVASDTFYDAHTQVTPVFDRDNNPAAFSASELEWINDIYRRVAEDYAPFNIDVTTQAPGASTYTKYLRINLGGNFLDWYIDDAGGVSGLETFRIAGNPNAFIFTDAFFSSAHAADAASHEAGHTFGLNHHSDWSPGGVKINEYGQGAGNWSPIMGGGYRSLATWWNGPGNVAANQTQDDMALIASPNNKFGYRADDVPGATQTARDLGVVDADGQSFSGLIGRNDDVDLFKITFNGGQLHVLVDPIADGANLDAVIELRDAANQVLQTANPGTQLATLTANLAAGVYYLAVRSNGEYGRVGQYTVTASVSGPHAVIRTPGGDPIVPGDGPFDLPQVPTGGPAVYAAFTLQNTGDQTLTLGAAVVPAGFLLQNALPASLLAGQQITISIARNPASTGEATGTIEFATNDPGLLLASISVRGVVGTPTAGVLNPDDDDIGDGVGSVFELPTQQYKSALVPVSFTIRNTGDASLVLNSPQVPLGFVFVGLPPSTIDPGEEAIISIARDTQVVGDFGGAVTFTTNDPESPTLQLGVHGIVDPAKPDLSATITTVFPAATIGGKSGSAKVRILNQGTLTWTGLATIQLFVLPGVAPGGGDVPVATLTKSFTIKINKNTTQTIRFVYPTNPDDGTFNVVAVVSPAAGQVESNTENNTAASLTSIFVAKPFTLLTGALKPITKPLKVTSTFSRSAAITNSGNVQFKGAASAEVYISADGFFDEADALFGVITKNMTISAGKTGSLTIKVTGPLTIAPGTYTLFLVIPAYGTTGAGVAVTFV